jgi:hypothetical protein
MLILLLLAAVFTFVIVTVLIKRAERKIHDRFVWRTQALDPQIEAAESLLIKNVRVVHRLYDWEREGWFVLEERTGRLDELA